MRASAAPRRCSSTIGGSTASAKVIRIFNTYGPRMYPGDGRVVSSFIVQALTGADITIYGVGRQTRSFCYIDDLVGGMMAMMDDAHDLRGPNLGNPDEFTMLELAELVIELTGSRSAIVHAPLPQDDPKERQPDISLARERLGWAPEIALRDRLAKAIDYFQTVVGAGHIEKHA